MPVMSKAEALMCRSAPWRLLASRVVLPWVLSDAELRDSVLEIGGGSGAMAQTVLADHPDVQLTMVDLDPAMVASAERRLAPFGARARTEVADVTQLPFEDASFETVLSFIMLHHVVRWQPALTEAARVLKPGGQLLGYDLTENRMTERFHQLDRSTVEMLSSQRLRDGLADAGFAPVVVHEALCRRVMRFHARRSHKPDQQDQHMAPEPATA